jgi:hypothetical protein
MIWAMVMVVVALILVAALVGFLWLIDARRAEHVAHDRGRLRP